MMKNRWEPWHEILLAEYIKRKQEFDFDITPKEFEIAVIRAFGNEWYHIFKSMPSSKLQDIFSHNNKDTQERVDILEHLMDLGSYLKKVKFPQKDYNTLTPTGSKKYGSHGSNRHK